MMSSPTNNGAEALLALKSSPPKVKAESIIPNGSCKRPMAKLTGADFDYFINQDDVVIGRNSSHGNVDVNIGVSSYVSRRHLKITRDNCKFYLKCMGKNGVFVDGHFQRLGAESLPLKET